MKKRSVTKNVTHPASTQSCFDLKRYCDFLLFVSLIMYRKD